MDKIINNLPFELHIPRYKFCGPGTTLDKRLERGDANVNGLDKACREHDITYSNNKDLQQRHIADAELATRFWERVKAGDSTFVEKFKAFLGSNAMKAKVKLGMGIIKIKGKKQCGSTIFKTAIKNATAILKKEKPQNIYKAIAQKAIKKSLKGMK